LDFYRLLASRGAHFLEPDGKLMCEFGDGQEVEIRAIFEASGWIVESVEFDFTRRPRFVIARAGNAAQKNQPSP
jgi:methylase of polypeptide subunit release factors